MPVQGCTLPIRWGKNTTGMTHLRIMHFAFLHFIEIFTGSEKHRLTGQVYLLAMNITVLVEVENAIPTEAELSSTVGYR